MSTTVLAMRTNHASTSAKIAALDKTFAELRATAADTMAPAADLARAERPLLTERRQLAESFLRSQSGLAEGARKAWLAATPASVQRKAAIGNPTRAVAVAQLAALAGPREASKLAALLVAEQDAAGGFGYRAAVAAFPADNGHDLAAVVAVALKAGTSESDDALKVLLGAKREYANSVAVVGSAEEKLSAAHAAQEVEQDDGSSQWYSEQAIEALIGPPGA